MAKNKMIILADAKSITFYSSDLHFSVFQDRSEKEALICSKIFEILILIGMGHLKSGFKKLDFECFQILKDSKSDRQKVWISNVSQF